MVDNALVKMDTALVAALKKSLDIDDGTWETMSPEEQAAAVADYREEMVATVKSAGIQSFTDFPSISFPTSGSAFWTRQTPEGEEPLKRIEGAIILAQQGRRFYKTRTVSKGTPPTCWSPDGKVPVEGPERQASTCGVCPHAAWGTGIDNEGRPTRGQACDQRMLLWFYFVGQMLPNHVGIPPTSLKAVKGYITQLASSGQPIAYTVTRLDLVDAANKDGTSYKEVRPTMIGKLSQEERKFAKEMRGTFMDAMVTSGAVVAEVEEPAPTGEKTPF